MKKKIIILVALGIAISSYLYYLKYQSTNTTENIVLSANVDIRDINLAFLQTGRLESLLVDEGDLVKKGQLLATLDNRSFKNSLNIAKANLALAKAELAKVLSGNRNQNIEAAAQEIKRLKSRLNLATTTLKRQEKLRVTGAVSQGSLDNARAIFRQDQALLAASKQKLSLLQEGADKEAIAIATAKIAIMKAQLELITTTLSQTNLYAPTCGIIQTRIVEPGSIVNPNTPVLSLLLEDKVYIRAYIDEPLLGNISIGQKVSITTDSSDKTYHGHIGFIAANAEFTPKSVATTTLRSQLVYRIRIIVDGSFKGLNKGQPVTINIQPKKY